MKAIQSILGRSSLINCNYRLLYKNEQYLRGKYKF